MKNSNLNKTTGFRQEVGIYQIHQNAIPLITLFMKFRFLLEQQSIQNTYHKITSFVLNIRIFGLIQIEVFSLNNLCIFHCYGNGLFKEIINLSVPPQIRKKYYLHLLLLYLNYIYTLFSPSGSRAETFDTTVLRCYLGVSKKRLLRPF